MTERNDCTDRRRAGRGAKPKRPRGGPQTRWALQRQKRAALCAAGRRTVIIVQVDDVKPRRAPVNECPLRAIWTMVDSGRIRLTPERTICCRRRHRPSCNRRRARTCTEGRWRKSALFSRPPASTPIHRQPTLILTEQGEHEPV